MKTHKDIGSEVKQKLEQDNRAVQQAAMSTRMQTA